MDIQADNGTQIHIDGNTIIITTPRETALTALSSQDINDAVVQTQFTEFKRPQHDLDPKYYHNGHNNLTVQDSVNRAASYLEGPFMPNDSYLRDGCERIIRNVDGRDGCYRLAGAIKKLANAGYFKGISLSYVFYSVAHNYIDLPPID